MTKQEWEEFDEAVEYLKTYLATDGKMWQSAIISAHRVLELLKGDIQVELRGEFTRVFEYIGGGSWGFIIEGNGFAKMVSAAVAKSAELTKWRKGQ